jgi:hypothetical protein
MFGDEVVNPIVAGEVERHCDVGIGNLAQAQSFAAKLTPHQFAQQWQLGQRLERHIAMKPLIARAKHYSHTAGTDLLEDAVMAQNLANRWSSYRH